MDRDFAILESTMNLEFSKCSYLMEMADMNFKLNLAEADHKVLLECGDMTDIDMFYEAAAEEAGNKKKGIIKTAFEAIKKFIDGVLDKIRGVFSKGAPNSNAKTNVEEDPKAVEKNVEVAMNKAQSLFNKAKNGISNIGNELAEAKKSLAVKVGAVLLTGVGLFAAGKGISNALKKHKGTIEGMQTKVENEKDPNKQKKMMEALGVVKSAMGKLGECASSLWNKAKLLLVGEDDDEPGDIKWIPNDVISAKKTGRTVKVDASLVPSKLRNKNNAENKNESTEDDWFADYSTEY